MLHADDIHGKKDSYIAMQGKPARYCYRNPRFPATAFVVNLWMEDEDGTKVIYPMGDVFTDVDDMQRAVVNTQRDLEKKVEVMDQVIVAPIKFKRLFQLKREYWQTPQVRYKPWDQMLLYLRMLQDPAYHMLVVTPLGVYQKKEYFMAPIPFRVTTSDIEIDTFMRVSDAIVDETAKFAAIYSVGQIFGYNFKTGQIYQNLSSERY